MSQIIAKIDWKAQVKLNFFNRDLSKFQKPYCDHCHSNHNLRYTYVIELDDNSLIQVGEECLKDVLGIKPNIKHYASEESFNNYFCGRNSRLDLDTKRTIYLLSVYLHQYKIGADLKLLDITDLHSNEFIKYVKSIKEDLTETEKVMKFFETFNPTNDFTENLKNLMTSEGFDVRYFNTIKYCFKVYDDTINYKPLYNSKITDYTTTQVKEIEFIGTRNYSGYSWETESKKYRIIDTQNNVFEFCTSTDLQVKAGDKISFKYSMSYGQKMFQNTKKYGFINRIRNLKIIKGE